MKIMNCPLNGPRNISEFVYGGEVTELPDVDNAPDKEWAEHTFYAYNGTGVAKEWWYHVASGYWFIAERHRVTDKILATYDPSEDPAFSVAPATANTASTTPAETVSANHSATAKPESEGVTE